MPKLSDRLKRITKLLKYVFPDQTYERRRQMAKDNFQVKKKVK
jgi:lauroyl/myristoyl acyltransferase